MQHVRAPTLGGHVLPRAFFESQRHGARRDPLMFRYLSLYGTLIENILAGCTHTHDLGLCFADTLYQVEVDYLIQFEWATCVEDILWRRTKLGLTMDAMAQATLADYMGVDRLRTC